MNTPASAPRSSFETTSDEASARPVYGTPDGVGHSSAGYGIPYRPSTYEVATGQATGHATMSESDRSWSVAAHLSGFVAAWFALGFLGPLTVWLLAGQKSQVVRRHAVEALNFNLTILLYAAVSAVLLFVLIGFVLLPMVGLFYLVASIMAAKAASEGRDYRYPLTLRFIR